MITKLSLHNFKCYPSESFDLGKLTIFCGNNSVGKSTAIQALAIPFQNKFTKIIGINGHLVTLGSSTDIFSRNAKDGDESLSINISFESRQKYDLSWGFDNFNEQLDLKNHLTIKNGNLKNAQSICNHYFKNSGFQFIEAERYGPREYFNINRVESGVNWLGSKGQFSYEVYSSLDETGTRLSKSDLRTHPLASQNSSIRRNINYWMSEISPGFSIEPDTVKEAGISYAQFQAYGSNKTLPVNMGFGLSYCLSVVISLLVTKPGGLVVIENPEAHLHPRGQSFLGRLIALSALSGVQVIIETHSDHLLNGLRVISRLHNEYKEGDFKLYYISSTNRNETSVEKIEIGKKGDLSSWPAGFFDQQAYDLRVIIKGEDVANVPEVHK